MLITGLNSNTVTFGDEKTADSCQKQSTSATVAETPDAGKSDAVTLSKEALLLAYQNKSPANSAEGTDDDDLVDFVELMFKMMQRYHEESLESAEKTSRKHREEQLERMAATAEEQQASSEAAQEDTAKAAVLSASPRTSASGEQDEASGTDISSARTGDTVDRRRGQGRRSLLGYARHNNGENADFRIRRQV